MLGLYKKLYDIIPVPIILPIIKFFNINPYENQKIWRRVEKLSNLLNSFQDNPEIMVQYLNNQLGVLYSFAVTNSSFWNGHLKNISNLNLDSLQYCAPINSEILRKEFKNIVNYKIPGYITSTGGSGRNPSKLYLSDESYYLDIIHVLWNWKQLGYKCGDRKLTLRGVNLGNRLTKINPIYNELLINIFLMKKSNAHQVYHKIKDFKPTFGHGYPSTFVRMATILQESDIKIPLKGISFVSESFREYQRKIVQDVFNCDVLSFYGLSERCGFASEKFNQKGIYLILPTYGFIEILKSNNERAKEGESGEITCTGFINKGMPLIRYRTGDYAIVGKLYKGIVIEMKNIIGRWGKDYVIDKEGNMIPTTAINIHSKVQYKFEYIQICQKNPGIVNIKLVPWKFDSPLNGYKKQIKKDFQEKLKTVEVMTEICTKDELYISHRGKVPYLVSEVKQARNY